jgi:hypothetical protein
VFLKIENLTLWQFDPMKIFHRTRFLRQTRNECRKAPTPSPEVFAFREKSGPFGDRATLPNRIGKCGLIWSDNLGQHLKENSGDEGLQN